ncbi:glycosyltransferase family 4 protein [Sulfurimonas sp.]
MKNKNILELCLAHGLGGLEMFVAHCYEDFSKKGVCKVVVAEDSKLDHYLGNIDKFYIQRSKFFPFIPAKKLAHYIDDNAIDIIHFHWTKDILVAVLAKIFSKRKPKLVQSRHMRMTRFKKDFYHKWLYKNVNMMHAVTKAVAEQLQKFIPEDIRPHIEMIYLGVQEPKIDQQIVGLLKKQYPSENAFVVGIVGRIEEGKGQHKVIEAISMLQELNIKAFIIGSAMNEDYIAQLQKMVKDLHLEEKILFTGFTKDINEYMSLCDTIVLATENETFGLVVIEAMANKKPVIATNRGGPTEIIENEKDGLLFDGSSEDLAKDIRKLYENKELKQKIAIAGYQKVNEKFNAIKQLDKLYKAITT